MGNPPRISAILHHAEAQSVQLIPADLTNRGARVLKGLKDYDYGLRDFDVADLDGNMIFFGVESQNAS